MKLTPRQARQINNIIQEEVQNVLTRRRNVSERLDVTSVDERIMNDIIGSDQFMDFSTEFASEVLTLFRKRFFVYLAKKFNEHAVSEPPVTVDDFIGASLDSEFDEDTEVEVSGLIASALTDYAKEIATTSVSLFGGLDVEDRGV